MNYCYLHNWVVIKYYRYSMVINIMYDINYGNILMIRNSANHISDCIPRGIQYTL